MRKCLYICFTKVTITVINLLFTNKDLDTKYVRLQHVKLLP